MKVNVMRRENELIIDYIREKDYDKVRYLAFEYIAEKHAGNLTVYINTNNKKRNSNDINIEKILSGMDTEYASVPAEKIRRKVIDLSIFFSKKEKSRDMSENVYLIAVKEKTDLQRLYNELLQYYDYGLGVGDDIDVRRLIEKFDNNADKILFNKKYFLSTLYDSLVFYRMRMDAPYNLFADYMEGRLNKKRK